MIILSQIKSAELFNVQREGLILYIYLISISPSNTRLDLNNNMKHLTGFIIFDYFKVIDESLRRNYFAFAIFRKVVADVNING